MDISDDDKSIDEGTSNIENQQKTPKGSYVDRYNY